MQSFDNQYERELSEEKEAQKQDLNEISFTPSESEVFTSAKDDSHRPRIPSLYERSMSAKLSRATSDDSEKWCPSFYTEHEPFTDDITEEDMWKETASSGYHKSKPFPEKHSDLDDDISPPIEGTSEDHEEHLDDTFSQEDSSEIQEETDEKESVNVQELEHTAGPQQAAGLYMDAEADGVAVTEAKSKRKHEISKSKRRRLQRLRRKHAAEAQCKGEQEGMPDTQHDNGVHTTLNLSRQADEGSKIKGDNESPNLRKGRNVEHVDKQSSTTTDNRSQDFSAEKVHEDRHHEISSEEHLSELADSESEPRMMKKRKKRQRGDERTVSSNQRDRHAAALEEFVESSEEEAHLRPKSRLQKEKSSKFSDPADVGVAGGPTAERARASMPALRVTSDEDSELLHRDQLHSDQQEDLDETEDASAAGTSHLLLSGTSRSRSRSRSPAPPNLRRITGQPQRRRPRKNIIVVANPQKF